MVQRTIDGECKYRRLFIHNRLTSNRALVKKYIGSVPFFLLNVTFISFMQSVLLFLLATPTYGILLASQHEKDISVADLVFVGIELGLVITEWFADQQQWGKLCVCITKNLPELIEYRLPEGQI